MPSRSQTSAVLNVRDVRLILGLEPKIIGIRYRSSVPFVIWALTDNYGRQATKAALPLPMRESMVAEKLPSLYRSDHVWSWHRPTRRRMNRKA